MQDVKKEPEIIKSIKRKICDFLNFITVATFFYNNLADSGSRTRLSGLGSPRTTDVLYPRIYLT